MKKYYKDKKILITGHTGFKGSWLALTLKLFGNKIYGISEDKRKSGFYKVIQNKKIFSKEFIGDISDEKFLKNSFKNLKIDIVFHFAAQGLVSEANLDPLNTINTNIIGTYNVMNICNANKKINLLVIATTDKVYENHNFNNTEESKLGGKEFYSASKASSEHIIQAFINTKKRDDLFIGIVRAGNVLGGGDYAKDRILTDILESINKGKDIILRNPNSIRPWQYILDSINGYLLVGHYCFKNKTNSIFNLNSKLNNKNNVHFFVKLLVEAFNLEKKIKVSKKKSFYESDILKIDSKKANHLLNWTAKCNMKTICTNIMNYEQSQNKYEFSVSHIKEFFEVNTSK